MNTLLAFIFWFALTGINFVLVLDAISDNSIFWAVISFSTLILAIINLNIIIKKVNK